MYIYIYIICIYTSDWWFQAIPKILVKLDHDPRNGGKEQQLKPPDRYRHVKNKYVYIYIILYVVKFYDCYDDDDDGDDDEDEDEEDEDEDEEDDNDDVNDEEEDDDDDAK